MGGVVREERRGGGGGQPPTSCCGGAGPPEQPFFQTYRRLANAFAPTGCVGGFPGPVGSVGKMRQMHILVGCIKSVCVQNAFGMRSLCVRKCVQNTWNAFSRAARFWASFGAFRARLACLSHTLGTRTQTSAVPGRGWGCYVHCEQVLLLASILTYEYIHTHTILYLDL